jgi:hypothetical protein
MKKLSFFSSLFTLAWFIFAASVYSQDLKIIHLDCSSDLLAKPAQIVVSSGDEIQFIADNGEFAIFIDDAALFLDIDTADLQIHLDSKKNPTSDKYVVRSIDSDRTITYTIYCITNDTWPDAPPKIIIRAD